MKTRFQPPIKGLIGPSVGGLLPTKILEYPKEQRRSAARDARHGDRDGRAPRSCRYQTRSKTLKSMIWVKMSLIRMKLLYNQCLTTQIFSLIVSTYSGLFRPIPTKK